MLAVSHLLADVESFGDKLRYTEHSRGHRTGTHAGAGPVVVWSVTRSCNLKCMHCYANSENKKYEGELTTEEALGLIDEMAAMKVPVILFSGGEPLVRPDIFELAEYAIGKGIRITFSTNGTLIDQETARRIKEMGVGYVGISLDGIGQVHDYFRQKNGAFDAAIRGVRNCMAQGQKVGLRFTMNRHNIEQLPLIFDLMEEEGIQRACFYHLVYSGRGSLEDDISHEETRQALDLIFSKAQEFTRRGIQKELLTVDNHADGVYLYMKALEQDKEKAASILNKLQMNGGNRTGIAICNIDHLGNVHPDQFTPSITFGNVKMTPFRDIWHGTHPVLEGLRNRKPLLTGRCSQCKYLDICNGNFRSRALAVHGELWAEDPACFLTDEEIAPGPAREAAGL
ncbi:radical SAM protein [Gorillibacterium sp. sgz5001074]|uniref:radical SAM protein n=1 Tax=Gorillibacterium sp. sgz5001074 TaxID=3446695 RepID=UPI003F669697